MEQRVLEVVRGLVAELGGASRRPPQLDDLLDRDLGISSLERVELLLRLEQTFGVRLPDDVMANAQTVGSLVEALRGVRARTLLIAFSSDWLYPPSGSEELAAALRAAGKPVECHVMDAPYGHDCFLLEEARQTPMIRQFLGLPT